MDNNDDESTKWFTLFKKSINSNSQLAFSKKLSVSVIENSTKIPVSDIIDMKFIQEFSEDKINNCLLAFFIDNRTCFFENLTCNDVVNFSIYFPLSKEKYNFTGTRIIISNKKKINTTIENKAYCDNIMKIKNSLLKLNEKEIQENNSIELINNFCDILNKTILKDEKKIKECWDKLNNEEKLLYEVISPETLKIDAFKEKKMDDLSKFEAQEELLPNDNFSLVYLIPFEVDYFTYPMPQVIANSRKPNFESLYKPPKKTRRYYFIYNFNNNKWLNKELNP